MYITRYFILLVAASVVERFAEFKTRYNTTESDRSEVGEPALEQKPRT